MGEVLSHSLASPLCCQTCALKLSKLSGLDFETADELITDEIGKSTKLLNGPALLGPPLFAPPEQREVDDLTRKSYTMVECSSQKDVPVTPYSCGTPTASSSRATARLPPPPPPAQFSFASPAASREAAQPSPQQFLSPGVAGLGDWRIRGETPTLAHVSPLMQYGQASPPPSMTTPCSMSGQSPSGPLFAPTPMGSLAMPRCFEGRPGAGPAMQLWPPATTMPAPAASPEIAPIHLPRIVLDAPASSGMLLGSPTLPGGFDTGYGIRTDPVTGKQYYQPPLVPNTVPLDAGVDRLNPIEVHHLLQQPGACVLVDCRGEDQASGLIMPSINEPTVSKVPLHERLPGLVRRLAQERLVIFTCQYSAHRAPTTANYYRKACHPSQRVAILNGGFRGWESCKLPVQAAGTEADGRAADDTAIRLGSMVLTGSTMLSEAPLVVPVSPGAVPRTIREVPVTMPESSGAATSQLLGSPL